MDDYIWYDEIDEDYEDDDRNEIPWDEHESFPYTDLYEVCLKPTLLDILLPLGKLFGSCALMRFANTCGVFPHSVLNLLSVAVGIWLAWQFFKDLVFYLLLFCVIIYIVIFISDRLHRFGCSFPVILATALYLILCEMIIVKDTSWHMIRGPMMILSMKSISVGIDIDSKRIPRKPTLLNFASYCFTPSTLIFGPWIMYSEYLKLYHTKSAMNLWWIPKFFCAFLKALFFLSVSTCWTHWLIDDAGERSKWIIAYRDALSYRTSHYFVSFVSEASVILAGFPLDLKVTQPLHVELPRSLVDVVAHWNIPMHCWLKTYVFKVARPYGSFAAILATYIASSMLHGMNFQLTAVLLSLGFYTYIEYEFRNKLSSIFKACLLAKKCKNGCAHTYTKRHPVVLFTNYVFFVLSLTHLTYLGLMFDSSPSLEERGYSMEHTLHKWRELNYVSHWIAAATFMFHKLI